MGSSLKHGIIRVNTVPLYQWGGWPPAARLVRACAGAVKNPATTAEPPPDPGVNSVGQIWADAVAEVFQQWSQRFPLRSLAVFGADSDDPPLLASAGVTEKDGVGRLKLAATGKTDGAADASQAFSFPIRDGSAVSAIAAWETADGDAYEETAKLGTELHLAFENAVLRQKLLEVREQEKNRLERLRAVYDIGQAIHNRSGDDLLRFVCEKAASVMQAQACSLMLKNDSNELVIAASFGLKEEIVQRTRIPRGTSIAWLVAQSAEPALLNESPSQQIGDITLPERSGIQSSMCVPLRGHDQRVVGVLSIRRMVPAPEFVDEDLRLFCVIADQVSLAIANADLLAHLNRRVNEMATVNRLTAAINSTLDLEYVLAQIADCIIDVVGFSRCIVYLTDYRKGLEARIVRGYGEDDAYARVLEEPSGIMALAIREQIVISAEGEELMTASPVEDPESAGSHALIAAPIVVRRQTIGVIVADNQNTARPVEPAQVELLSTFVNHAGLAIENSRLYEAMEQKYSELNVLYELSRTIGSAYGLDNAVELLLEVTMKAVPYSSAAFALVNDNLHTASVHSTRHIHPDHPVPWQTLEETELAQLISELRDPTMVLGAPDSDSVWTQPCHRLLEHAGALLLMPLIADRRLVGVLALSREFEHDFNSNDVKLLSIISSHASVVIKNAVSYERSVQEKVLELSALYEFSQRISTAGTLTEALDSILAIVSDLVECDECLIWTVDAETGALDLRASRLVGLESGGKQIKPQVDAGLAAWAVRERKAIALADIRQDSRFSAEMLQGSRVRSLMSIPLMVQDEVVGVLSVHSYTPSAYTESQVRVLSVVASQAASLYRGLEALTALTSYTDNILTSVAAGVVALGTDGTVVSWNRAAEEILELSSQQALGQELFDVLEAVSIPKEDISRLISAIERLNSTGESERGVEIAVKLGEDRTLHLTLSISRLQSHAGEPLGLVIIFEDVTRQVEMQVEVRRMHELAAIGQLAASIAHELRNPLSSIKGAAQFLQHETHDPSTVEFLGIILEEVDGLNKIASEFLDFARQLKLETSEVRLSEVIQKQLGLLAPQLEQANITVKSRVADDVPPIICDQKHLEQVLLNLALNSMQAMPEGGRLSVSAQVSQKWPRHVQIDIKDTGAGIPPERLGKIFTPFFTTKVKGTGLGLPVVQKIVQNHQGHIEVDSREGEGALFRIHLPIEGPRPSLLGDFPDSPPDLLERT